MKEEYVFEVSKLRALEGRLLSTHQLYEMASAKDEGEVQGLLESAGYEISDDFQKTLAQRKKSLLSQLFETVENCPELDTLLTKNDIQNIKRRSSALRQQEVQRGCLSIRHVSIPTLF